MKSSVFLFLSLILLCSCLEEEEFPLENDIMVLTNVTFDKAIEKFEYILVMFYAPWCGHCKKFKPELEKAAATLRKENLMVAKVDATIEKDLASKYKVRGYPTVKFFKKGIPIDYKAKRTEKDVINWVRKKSSPPARKLTTFSDVEDLQKNNDVCIVYFGKNEDDLKAFIKVAEKNEDLPFAIVEDEEIAKKFNAKQKSVVLFKKFDEKRNDLEAIKEKELSDFVEKYSMKKVGSFDKKTIELIFGKNQPAIVYFGITGDKWTEAEKLMEKLAEKLGDKLKVIMTEIKSDMGKNIAEYIGLKDQELPSVRILDTRNVLKKYIMDGEINEKKRIDLLWIIMEQELLKILLNSLKLIHIIKLLKMKKRKMMIKKKKLLISKYMIIYFIQKILK